MYTGKLSLAGLVRGRNTEGSNCGAAWAAIVHCKKRLSIFLSSAGMSMTKLSLAGNNLIIPVRQSLVSDIPAGEGKIVNAFYNVPL